MEKLLGIIKPAGFTSFQIVEYVKSLLPSKIKVGHAGTLDPLAEGVLVIGIGKATKQLKKIESLDKEYIALGCFGLESETLDREGKVIKVQTKEKPSLEEVSFVLSNFKGKIKQLPPIFSAKKIKGERAYRLARAGKKVQLKAKEVWIKDIELLFYAYPFFGIRVTTGPGVYIRALIRDVAKSLHQKAILYYLRRERVGSFTLDNSLTLEQLPKKLLN